MKFIRVKYLSIRTTILAGAMVGLTACNGVFGDLNRKANAPVPRVLAFKMKAKGMALTSPIMLRIFKEENTLEVWKRRNTGRYALLTSYEICKWSGKLGPKFKEGDRQAPEGFYRVNKHQMNPNSQYHLSFNMGFPNAYDRAHERTGSHLMIHGACSSAGCYSMTDEKVEEIYAMARDAFKGGQKAFQIQAFPFRMTPENMIKNRDHQHFEFWKMLKKGYDHFEITKMPPKVDVCERRYVFNTESEERYPSSGQCPSRSMPVTLATAYVAKQKEYSSRFEALLAEAENRPPVTPGPITIPSALPGVTVVASAPSRQALPEAPTAKPSLPGVTEAPISTPSLVRLTRPKN